MLWLAVTVSVTPMRERRAARAMAGGTQSPATRGFPHSLLILDSGRSVRQVLAPAVRQALESSDGVVMAVGADTARLLRDELGGAAGQLEWRDTSAFYQRLGFAYEAFRRFLADAHAAGRRIHLFAEPDVAGDGDDAGTVDRPAAYLAYEAICNETYAVYGCEVTCLWDARVHSAPTIDNVRLLHSHELGPAGREPSRGYAGARDYLASRNQLPLPLPAKVDWEMDLTSLNAIPLLRADLRDWARGRGFAPPAQAEVAMAVNEVATNALTHGKPPAAVRAWHDGDTVIVQVDDQGGNPLPATAGYVPPDGHYATPRGLWLVRQLADVMQTHTQGSTTSVRLYFPHQLTHRHPPRGGEAPGS